MEIEAAEASRYWCHMCSQMVNPIMEIETIKCPICQSGFVEEMTSTPSPRNDERPPNFGVGGIDSDRALSLWAPIFLGMMSNPHRNQHHPHRIMPVESDSAEEGEEVDNENNHRETHQDGATTDLVRELESAVRQTRRSSATIFRLIQGIQALRLSETQRERENDQNADRVIVINPFNQTIILRGSYDPNGNSQNRAPLGSFGDYFIGPGFDLLMQRLANNDPNVYGTPPAQKEAVEALPTVKIEEKLQCSICLDDCEIGSEVKEMPCKHKFHSECIMPWLELHSSCPVCRHQLPSDESKTGSEGSRNNMISSNEGSDSDDRDVGVDRDSRNENGGRFSIPLPWPFSILFSSFSSQSSTENSSTNTSQNTLHGDEN